MRPKEPAWLPFDPMSDSLPKMPSVTEAPNQALSGELHRDDSADLSGLVVRAAQDSDYEAIDGFVSANGGSLFQASAWSRAIQKVFRHQRKDIVAHQDGELVGLLPMMQCRGLFGGSHLISTPYGVYGGPLSLNSGVTKVLVDAALVAAKSINVGRLELRSRYEIEHPGLVHSDRYVTFVKELAEDYDGVLKSMKKDERRLVRRATDTHGLELDQGSWFLQDLARLFHASKRGLGSPGLPVAWFRALQEGLGENAPIHIVRRGSEVLAASMCFIDGKELRMYYIGTAPDANRNYNVTSFMIAELQRWAIERGLEVFDLGRSRSDAGAVKFKKNQGFSSEPLHYSYGLVRSKSLPSFTPSNPRTVKLRQIWSKLPPALCVAISNRISRFLP
ncbi:MAG: FemAB-related protein (PEP-CTERM system-associated) [Planctomycetota bacterium]|jgi:FemAB-related protein (PEP-CTERM system-associated)